MAVRPPLENRTYLAEFWTFAYAREAKFGRTFCGRKYGRLGVIQNPEYSYLIYSLEFNFQEFYAPCLSALLFTGVFGFMKARVSMLVDEKWITSGR